MTNQMTNQMTNDEKRLSLINDGWFVVGVRDPRLNQKYPGQFMVAENCFEDCELPTQDGSNGPWCIVGDNLASLVDQAWECWGDEIARNHERALAVAKLSDEA